ncbi:MAG: fumarate reductase (CoM/CoB) subunit TfrA [Methanoregula sp.]|jgi:fumarate reductase (CoM/CoB) subunit A|uniref:fumarate reductase (CoM/CoB) subunit TfrA n=1 Tax=Methanoregula sp. TaxID=2052170 RepID=UPI003C26AF98
MHADDVVDCHVLVIGSGGAGVRAAIEAAPYGDTVLVTKTIAGKGGCTPMAEGGYNAVLRKEDSCEIHYEDTLKGGAYLNDPELVRILVQESPLRMDDLIRWGAVFDFTDKNEVAQRPFGGQRFPRTCYAGDRTGHEMMMTLVEQLDSSGVTKLQEVTVIDLLKDGNRVAGAIALDENGSIVILTADSTILATGGGSRVYDISTNSSSGTGDGFAMGYRAGAELIDMEMVQFHPTGAVYPYDARGRLITEAVRGEGGILKNRLGERFMKKYDPDRMELSTRDVVARAIATEIANCRGTERGGVWLDVTHLPKEQIETRLPVMLEQFLKFGVDIRTEPMEVAPTAHHIMGGLKITPECRTTLSGLFACGESAGGVQGANRLGGNALADTQVFGKRAGEFAAKAEKRAKKIDPAQIARQEERLDRFLSGTDNPAAVRTGLQQAMWKGAGIFRDEAGLMSTLAVINRLMQAPLRAASQKNLADCCIVENMCLTASLICRSALIRPESRGAHMRVDIPQEWDAAHSPYGHTYISKNREGIERRRVAA